MSLATLLSVYKHPAAEPKLFISEILKNCHSGKGITKEPPRIPLSLMLIAVRAYNDFPAFQKEHRSLAQQLFAPCLGHASEQVRLKAIDSLIYLGQAHQDTVDKAIAEQTGLRPIIYDIIKDRK